MTKINFGKYQGRDTNELAKFTEGRDYLSWGAKNLKNVQLRQEFAMALENVTASEIDLNLEAESIMKSDAQIDPQDAYILARDIRSDLIQKETAYTAINKAEQDFFYALSQAGIDARNAKKLFSLMGNGFDIEALEAAEKNGQVKFTSAQKRNVVWQAVLVLDGNLDNINF